MDETANVPPRPRAAVEVGTHTCERQYLFAFESLAEMRRYVRAHAASEEAPRLSQIFRAWDDAQPRVRALLAAEAGLPETISIEDIPPEYGPHIDALLDNERLRKTFSVKWSVKLVEIDKLIAAQRYVNLDHVERLRNSFPRELTLDALIKICLSPDSGAVPIQHLETPKGHIFTSPNNDFRFLGTYFHELTAEEAEFAPAIGNPAAAVISFVGYGTGTVNVLWSGQRCVLNNGFHRAYALRQAGVRKIPVIFQQVTNVQLEFPPVVGGLPRDYLLNFPRPAVVKDFFDKQFSTVLKVQYTLQMLTVTTEVILHDIPA